MGPLNVVIAPRDRHGLYSPILSVAASSTLLIARLVMIQATELSTLDSNLRGMLRRVSPRSIASPVFMRQKTIPEESTGGCCGAFNASKKQNIILSLHL